MSNPSIQLLQPGSAVEVVLAWDMDGATWDSGLFWDGSILQSQSISPSIGVVFGGVDIGVI